MFKLKIPAGARRWAIVAVVVVVVLLIAFSALSSVYVDLLWYREVHLSTVFWTRLRTNVLLGLVFGLLFFALLYANLLIVRRTTPLIRVLSPEQEAVERLRRIVTPYLRWLIPAACAFLALIVGISASHQWSTYLMWRNGSGLSFGNPEPLFHRDPSFYVFSLPWLHYVQSWIFSSLLGVTLLAAVAHFAWGGIQPAAPAFADKASPLVRAHLSVLLGLILLTRAWGYYLGRFDLLTSERGVVEGASYTDVRAQLPALNVLTLVAVICAVLFLVNIRIRRWSLPIIAVGLLAAVSILLGRAYPAFVQQFSVKPQEQQRETPYIADNIEGTRLAFGLDKVVTAQRPVNASVSAAALNDNQPTVSNIRLWRPSVLRDNFQSAQRKRQYYEFADVDVDRYIVDGQPRVLMVSGREVTQNGITAGGKSWQNTHLVYTHGFGAVAASVNTASSDGAPSLTLSDIPPTGQPAITEPRIYYGELNDVPFVVTKTGAIELDYEGADPADYKGEGGIPMGNRLQRALFAWRYNDPNLLISSLIGPDSRIMIYRQIQERVPKPAPFLKFDADPYLAVVDGRLTWIYDAYTTTTSYPYSQSIDLSAATDNLLAGRANYMRNSVKVTVDAYDGTMTYYFDGKDPIATAWSKAFPGMFTPIGEASADLQAHFRYPENLFQVQATHYATYHVTDPAVFFQKGDVWQTPVDPTIAANNPADSGPMRPYYVLLRLPDSTEEHFQLILPFTPAARPNLTSWMAANSDPGVNYGQLIAYTFPADRGINGPEQVFNQVNQDPTFSTFRTLLGQQGSDVRFGDLLVIPIDDSLIYALPVYVQSKSSQGSSIPELKRVVVVNGAQIGVGTTLSEALAASTNGQVTTPPATGTGGGDGTGTPTQPPPTTGTDQLSTLLNQALQHFTAADAALKTGDLATYQTELTTAQGLVKQASDVVASTSPTTATTAASGTTATTTATSGGTTPTTAGAGAGTTPPTTSGG